MQGPIREDRCSRAPRDGRAVLGLLIAVSVVVAVLLHHHAAPSSSAMRMPATGHASAASHHMGPVTGDGISAHSTDGPGCPTGVLEHCASADVDRTAPVPPARYTAAGSANGPALLEPTPGLRSADRAPPDLSLLSGLRI